MHRESPKALSSASSLSGRYRFRSSLLMPYATLWGAWLEALLDHRSQHPPAIRDRSEIALTIDPVSLKAWHLDDFEPSPQRPQIHHCLDLEPVAVEVEVRQNVTIEGVVA